MLTALKIKNLTVFPSAEFEFGKNLNVMVGENGSGKSHILKAAYCAMSVNAKMSKGSTSDKEVFATALAEKLLNVFRPDELGRLARRRQGRAACHIGYQFDNDLFDLSVSFNTSSKGKVTVKQLPVRWEQKHPVFIPTRELLTIYPGFVSLYETTYLPFEETWRDTCVLLGAPLARGPRESKIRKLLSPLEEAMGGTVEVTSGRFYLKLASGTMEMHLVAEGLRKLAMVARLIATGSLLDKGYLFWDEPESNLNPKIIKTIAKTILHIANSGIQVFIATHSLFLLRELHILQKREFEGLDARCFGLHIGKDGAVSVKQGSSMDEVGSIAALDEDLQQSERYIDTETGAMGGDDSLPGED